MKTLAFCFIKSTMFLFYYTGKKLQYFKKPTKSMLSFKLPVKDAKNGKGSVAKTNLFYCIENKRFMKSITFIIYLL